MPQKDAASRKKSISPKQETFLLSYLSLPTLRAAALAAGISEDTGQRWLKLPEIQAHLQELRRAYLNEALAALVGHTTSAIATLASHMTDDEVPAGARIRAAQILLEQAIEVHKMRDLEQQIEALKAVLEDRLT